MRLLLRKKESEEDYGTLNNLFRHGYDRFIRNYGNYLESGIRTAEMLDAARSIESFVETNLGVDHLSDTNKGFYSMLKETIERFEDDSR